MNYLYHFIPKKMEGNILYPLNTLKEKYPDLYKQLYKKYEGREIITTHIIPVLNCLWNDVLHFSPVAPKEVKRVLIECGRDPDFKMNYFKVDPKLISPENAIVYLYRHEKVQDKLSPENFVSYDPEEVGNYSLFPDAAKLYYREMIEKGERVLLFHRIPHILYRGTLDVNDLERGIV